MTMQRKGLLLILSSPSGAGKSTLAQKLMAWDPTMQFSVSATTRSPRPGEVDGREYYFRTHAEFEALVAAGQMLEGRDTLFDIDWQGGQQIRASALARDVVSVFILPPSIAELDRRLRTRGQDSDEVIAGRMAKSESEISHWGEYDYVLKNDDLTRTFNDLQIILQAERMRRDRQPGLPDFIRDLQQEFAAR
jgi:guanylate kinase